MIDCACLIFKLFWWSMIISWNVSDILKLGCFSFKRLLQTLSIFMLLEEVTTLLMLHVLLQFSLFNLLCINLLLWYRLRSTLLFRELSFNLCISFFISVFLSLPFFIKNIWQLSKVAHRNSKRIFRSWEYNFRTWEFCNMTHSTRLNLKQFLP